jgi:hypothetical protein
MTPAETWTVIAAGGIAVMAAAILLTNWLDDHDPGPPTEMAVRRLRCECGRYLFLCGDPDGPHIHEYRDGGTVHRPDLCQPADEAL